MKRYILMIGLVLFACKLDLYAQLNTFFDGWIPVPYSTPASTTPVSAPTGTETVTISIDAANVINKVYSTHFGSNAASWVSKGMLTDGIRLPHLQRAHLSLLRWPDGSGSDEFFWDGVVPASFLSDPQLTPANGRDPWRLKSEDIVSLTSSIGGHPLVVVNFGYAIYGNNSDPVGTAAHYAAEFVRHMNGTLGANVKYWEVGNECYGNWEAGHTVNGVALTGTKYGQIFRVFVDSMKAADPSIKIGAVLYPTDGGYNNWSALVLPEVQNHADFLSIHEYFDPISNQNALTYSAMMAEITKVVSNYNSVQTMVQTYTSKPKNYFPIAMTEYNTFSGLREIQMANALYFPQVLGDAMKAGYGCVLTWASQNGTNSFGGDLGFLSKNDPNIPDYTPRPTYFVYHLMPQYTGEKVIIASSSDPNVYVFASKFQNGEIGITLVNLSSSAKKVKLNISNFTAGAKMYWHELYATNETDYKVYINGQTTSLARGGPDNYYAINPYSRSISGNFLFDAKPYSANFIALETGISLPLKILSFTGTNNNNSTTLSWTIASNNDIAEFEIQCSSDVVHFETIGQVNPSSNNKYQFLDYNVNSGFYYRIKQNNEDGSSDYSTSIFVENEEELWNVYPNFLENNLYVTGIKGEYQLSMFNLQGKEVYNTLNSGSVVSINNNLASGIYFIRIISGNTLKTFKVIKE